jgi:hypothetical protein
VGVVGSLAAAQLRHRPGRWGLLSLGVALALVLPVIAAGTGTVVSADTLRRTVAGLDPGSRGTLITDSRSIFDRGPTPSLDHVIDTQLARISSAPVRKELVFRQLTSRGTSFFLASVDHLSTAVSLESGRMPQSCTPRRCEVVVVGDGDVPALTLATASLGVVVVGRARRTDPLVVSGSFDTNGVPLLLGDGPNQMALLSSLELFSRTYGWVVALDVERVLSLGVPAYVRRSTAALNAISEQGLGFAAYPPDSDLTAANERAALSGRRFGLLGGSTAVLLLGFAIVAAVGLRREHALLVAVVRRRGARSPTVTRLTLYEAAAACLAGAVVGCALGAAACAWLATRADLPVARTMAQGLSGAAGGAILLTAAAIGLTVAVLLWPDTEPRSAWRTVDLLALASLGAAVLAASRGSVGASSLEDRADPLLVALPMLAAVTTGLIAARLWPPLARLAERLVPQRSLAGRIALLGAVRRPLRAVATTAFLTAAVASVVFAGAYRSTLLEGSADQAAYAVPLDATLQSSPSVPTPLAVTDPQQLAALAPGITAFGLVRSGGVVRTGTGDSAGLPVLGIDPAALPTMRRWQRTTGSGTPPSQVAAALASSASVGVGPLLPAGTKRLSVAVTGELTDIELAVWVANDSGREAAVTLSGRGGLLGGTLPNLGLRALRVVALTIRETADAETLRQHAIGEGNTALQDVVGTLHLGAVTADGSPVAWRWTAWSSGRTATGATATTIDIHYRLAGAAVVVQPGYSDPATAVPLPVIVDPATARAATGGKLALSLGETKVTAQIAGVLPRFPTVDGRFVLADRAALTQVLDGQQPGTGSVSELWVAADNDDARTVLETALRRAPYDRAGIALREPLERSLASDPVARGSRLLLALAAGLALLVAAAAVALLVSGDRRDDAGELHAWESDGVRPATLRRVLLVRALSVVAVAVPLGLLGGLLLAQVGADLVAVDASGLTPRPPLRVAVGAEWTGGVLLLGLSIAVGLAAGVAASALRERLPVRPDVELR